MIHKKLTLSENLLGIKRDVNHAEHNNGKDLKVYPPKLKI